MFIYQCGYIRWTRHNATVGFNSDTEYNNHPLSKTSNITDIDCNNATYGWTNIVYKFDQGNIAIMNLFIFLQIQLCSHFRSLHCHRQI